MRLLRRRSKPPPTPPSPPPVEVEIARVVAGQLDLSSLDELGSTWVRTLQVRTSEEGGVHHLLGEMWGTLETFDGTRTACGERAPASELRSLEECLHLPTCRDCTRMLSHVQTYSQELPLPTTTVLHRLQTWENHPAAPARLAHLLELPGNSTSSSVRCCSTHQHAPWSHRTRRLSLEHRHVIKQLSVTRGWIRDCERAEDHAPGAGLLLHSARQLEALQHSWAGALEDALRHPLSALCARTELLLHLAGHDALQRTLADAPWPHPELEDELGLDTTPTLVLSTHEKPARKLEGVLATHLLAGEQIPQARSHARTRPLQVHLLPRWVADQLLLSLERAHAETSPGAVEGVPVDAETARLALELWSPGRGFPGCVRDACNAMRG